jgi:hypothetical protein
MSKPYPRFFAVGDRLVAIVRTPDGDTECLVLDMRTGNLVSDCAVRGVLLRLDPAA